MNPEDVPYDQLALEQKLADVCAGCGLHAIADLDERKRVALRGGRVTCPNCRIAWTVTPRAPARE